MVRNKVAILISCFDWYFDRLIYIDKYLQKKGYSTYIYISDFNHITKKNDMSLLSSTQEANITYIHVPSYKRNISISRLWSHKKFSLLISQKIQEKKPDLVYCLVPPNSLVKEVSRKKNKFNYRLIFDIIDLWPESFPKGNTKMLPFQIWRDLRDKYIGVADMIVLECEYYRRVLEQSNYSGNIEVLHLIKKPLEKKIKPQINNNEICVCYLGSINSLIDINKISVVLKQLQSIKPVRVKIIGDGEKREEFVSLLKQQGCLVEYYGKIFDDMEKQRVFENCIFGINIYKNVVNIGLTMKSVDYFQMGIPILNSIPGDTKEFVDKYEVGINIENIDEDKIRTFIDCSSERRNQVLKVFDEFFSEANVSNRIKFLDKIV